MIDAYCVWLAGLLFLGADMESLTKMITGLKSASEQELEVLPIRHVTVLSSLGYLCTPGSMAEILHSRISMVRFILSRLATLIDWD